MFKNFVKRINYIKAKFDTTQKEIASMDYMETEIKTTYHIISDGMKLA